MHLTIVKPDDLTILDGHTQTFNLLDFDVPENLHALQWLGESGHIEYTDIRNESINSLPYWTAAIVDKHKRLTDEQEAEREHQDRIAVHQANGSVRRSRENARQQKLQQYINRLVLEYLA